MLCVNNHNFWKEIIAREERQLHTWSLKNKKPVQGRIIYTRPKEVMFYGNKMNPKTVKQGPILFYGAGDMKREEDSVENVRNRKKKKHVIQRKEKNYPDPRLCKFCQMVVYETPQKQEPERCRDCKRRVVYHCYRCCGCGYKPMDPRIIRWDEIPKMAQCEDERYLSDDDDLFNEYYDS